VVVKDARHVILYTLKYLRMMYNIMNKSRLPKEVRDDINQKLLTIDELISQVNNYTVLHLPAAHRIRRLVATMKRKMPILIEDMKFEDTLGNVDNAD